MADGVVAGKLEIPVESDTRGFAQELKRKVEAIAEGIQAKIDADLGDTKSLRKKLQAAVDKASEGVTAKIGVDVDPKALRAKVKAAAKEAGKESIKLRVKVENFAEDVARQRAEAESQTQRNPLDVRTRLRDRISAELARIIATNRAAAAANPIVVPVRSRNETQKPTAAPSPLFKIGDGGGMPARAAFRPLILTSIASLIQPAIATIVGGLGGLVPMVGNLSMAFKTLAVAPTTLGAIGAGFAVVKLATSALSGELKKLPKPLQAIRKEAESLKKPWEEMKKSVGLTFWSGLNNQIGRTGRVVIPILRTGLNGVAVEMAETVKQTMEWVRTPVARGQLNTVFYQMRTVMDGLGAAALGIVKGLLNIAVAAGPITTKFADLLRNFGGWAASIGQGEAKSRALGKSLEYAWQKGSQLWQMTKDLARGLANVFKAGRETGDSLLDSMSKGLEKFREWTSSAAGQNRIAEWFRNIEPVTRSVAKLIGEIGKALGRLAEDQTTAGLLDMLRTDLLPSLEKFLRNLGSTLGPQIVTFVTNVLHVLTQMSAAGSPLGQGLAVLNRIVGAIADLLESSPVLARNLGILLGALMGFRALTFFAGLLNPLGRFFGMVRSGGGLSFLALASGVSLFTGALDGIPGALQGAIAGLSTFLMMRPRIEAFGKSTFLGGFRREMDGVGAAFLYGKDRAEGFRGSLSGLAGAMGYGAGAAGRGLAGAASGLMGILGGPWGIAITAAAAGIGAWVQAQENARAAAKSFSDTLDKQTGTLTANSKGWIVDTLLREFNADDWRQATSSISIGINDVTRALEQGGPAVDEMVAKIDALITQASQGKDIGIDIGKLQALRSTITNTNRDMEGGRVVNEQYRKGLEGAGQGASDAAGGVGTLGSKLREMLPSAQEVTDALERLAGVTLSEREASRRAAESADELNAALKANGRTHDDNTAKGRANNAALDAFAKAQVAAAQASAQAGASTSQLSSKLETARARFIAAAEKAGYTRDQAARLATQMGLTGAAASGMAAKVAAIKGKTVTVEVRDRATAIAAAAQRAINSVTGKVVTVTTVFQTQGYIASLHAIQAIRNAKAYYGMADGGILQRFANGGLRLKDRLQSFANGAEQHIAQIAQAGSWRLWAEPETGGEAYIPLAESKRARSMEILEEVARRFGMALMPLVESGGAGQPVTMVQPRGRVEGSAGGGSPRVVNFQPGAIVVSNAAPEPGGKSIVSVLRDVGDFGLFGEDD